MPVPTRVDFVEERKQKRTSTDTKGLYSLWKKQKEGGREREGWYQRWLSLLKQTMTQQITLKYVWHIFSRSFAFNFMIRFTFMVIPRLIASFYILIQIETSLINNKINSKAPVGIYLLKVNNKNTRTRCEICSKLTIKIPERR